MREFTYIMPLHCGRCECTGYRYRTGAVQDDPIACTFDAAGTLDYPKCSSILEPKFI